MSRHAQQGNLTREASWIEITGPTGQVFRGGTRCCVHCGGHFPGASSEKLVTQLVTPEQAAVLQLQGKIVRGWCYNCGGPICGPQCLECVPMEQQLENIEKGRPLDFRPIMGVVPGIILG